MISYFFLKPLAILFNPRSKSYGYGSSVRYEANRQKNQNSPYGEGDDTFDTSLDFC